MEVSPGAHMEMDVSSSTEDVTQASEVTGSNGNVEMVVIVENVTDEESCSSELGVKAAADDSEVTTNVDSSAPQTSPQKGAAQSPRKPHQIPTQSSPQKAALQSPQISPQKPTAQSSHKAVSDTNPTKSPSKVSDPENSSLNDENLCNKNIQKDNLETPSVTTSQSEEIVESSSKLEEQKSPQKTISTPKKLSPIKVIDIHKSPRVSVLVSKSASGKEAKVEVKFSTPKKDTPPEKSALNGTVEIVENMDEDDSAKNTTTITTEVPEKEALNDSEMELVSDVSEKEHNKSISRELKSLIKSAKESKIISECNQLTTKTRKSRAPLDSANTSLNVSIEAERIKDSRRCSNASQKSNCSEKSGKVPVKRSMRSQNPEFVNKVKLFLNSVTSKVQKESDEGTDEEIEEANNELKVVKDIKDCKYETSPCLPKKNKTRECTPEMGGKLRSDPYCWRCHWEVEQPVTEKSHAPKTCTVCPRTFHFKCLSGVERAKISVDKSWVCPECMGVLHAESSETRSPAMKKISLARLCDLLNHALERMMDLNGVEPFVNPVDRGQFPDYDKYVVHPMDLTLMKDNISDGLYGSTEAFLADVQWVLHNSIIFNTLHSKLTAAARTLVRSCRAEMGEIEACPECYAGAHARKPTWFTDVCTTPHMLLWAKLKGFPYWPAKGMSVNNAGLVDVRFFGAHDRAWVPAKDCFLYSEKDPNNFRTKRQDIIDSMQEAEEHIRNISRKYGKFVYPPFKTQFDPSKLYDQLKMMIPSFEGEVRVPVKDKPNTSPSMLKDKRRSNSKSSKGSVHEGEISEGEESSPIATRKMADGADIPRLEDDEKDKTMEVHVKEESEKSEKTTRKRRRSEMEEAATLTIIPSLSKDKKKKKEPDSDEKASVKTETESRAATSSKEEQEKPKVTEAKQKEATASKSKENKDNEPTSSTVDNENQKKKDPQRLTPIKLVISTKSNKIIGKSPIGKNIPPRVLPIKIRQAKLDKSVTLAKVTKAKDLIEDKLKKRRNSKNKSLNLNSSISTPEKTEKPENSAETAANKKKDYTVVKNKEDAIKTIEKPATPKPSTPKPSTPKSNAESPKTIKNRIQFDDDTSLAVIAREVKGNVTSSNVSGLPTISSVRSLSSSAKNATEKKPAKTVEVTIEPNADSSLTPSSTTKTATVRKETPKSKEAEISLVGRVGVRAFARMTSPEPQKSKEVEVEIKAEPVDFDDSDRQLEKLDLMKAFRLRPVNPPATQQTANPSVNNLREVRINKVVMTPLNARKTAVQPPEVKPRARKTFPQPRKSDEGRSDLNSKNSMVYIPIQPPTTPGPRAPGRSNTQPATIQTHLSPRPQAPNITTTVTGNSIVNTVTAPLVPSSMSQLAVPMPAAASSTLPLVPTIGQVPTTVHTVPLITSVNGQWTFSLQPIMSVGGLDESPSPPLLNGLPERGNMPPNLQALGSVATPLVPNNVVVTSTMSPPTMVPVPTPAVVPAPVVITAPAASAIAPVGKPGVVKANATAPALSNLSAVSVVTPNKTNVESNSNPGEPPRLQQRPVLMNPLDSHTPIGNVPTPSTAGPVTAKLNQNAVKLTDFFRMLLEDSLEKLDEPSCQATTLTLQLEQSKWKHQQELEEMKHNHELVLAEMRSSFEKEKTRLTSELRRVAQVELESAVKAAKSKQWCANCSQEAQFYCCWNTSYCDYPCQRAHWNTHFSVCTQQRTDPADAASGPSESRLQPQPDTIPKSTTAPSTTPTLTVGGKLAQARAAMEQGSQQSSIIMSMDLDKSGNQTIRCLGTYKPNTPTPILINKQMINNEDATGKKVVTSGGYLIVGGGASAAGAGPVVTPPRRAHSIQYFT